MLGPEFYLQNFLVSDKDFENVTVFSFLFTICAFFYFLAKPIRRGKFLHLNQKIESPILIDSRICISLIHFIHFPLLIFVYFSFPKYPFLSAPTISILLFYFYKSFVYPFLRNSKSNYWRLTSFLYHFFANIAKSLLEVRIFLMNGFFRDSYRTYIFSILFILTSIVQGYYDLNITRLRQFTHYQIPQGTLFNFISSPHLLLEIIIWIFWISIFRYNEVSYALLLWLLPDVYARGENNHFWYQRYFKKSYPSRRQAMIPFLNLSTVFTALTTYFEYGGI